MLDDNKTVAVIAESIVCSERLDAYQFVLRSIFEMAPLRSKETVRVLASDCFVTSSLLEKLQIQSTCKLMWDHYHILEVVWPSQLGPHYFTMACPLLAAWLNSSMQEAFDATMGEICTVLEERPDHVSYIQGWGKDRHHFAAYLLDSYPGSLNRRGSSASEQNHSSYVAIIGSGFTDNPCLMLEKTIGRQTEINRKRNEKIAVYFCKSVRDREQALASGDQTRADALDYLSLWGLELWNKHTLKPADMFAGMLDLMTIASLSRELLPLHLPEYSQRLTDALAMRGYHYFSPVLTRYVLTGLPLC